MTKPNTSCTIELPASLRSENFSPSARNAVRVSFGIRVRLRRNPQKEKKWVVYAKKPFAGPQHVIQYLAHYTHRVAIANGRILRFEDGQVIFRWRDSAHGNKQKVMTLEAVEFMRRFLLHVLPRGFVKIRHFGYLANRERKHALHLCAVFFSAKHYCAENSRAEISLQPREVRRCPYCEQGKLVPVARLSSAQLRARNLIPAFDTS